ncbi:DUF4011 domain-containing protein [Rhodovarius crocodyli]|uniref:DUF4011 domain-containing protein n=1 Tax=Rhodovarius crocodyli TaxID=1979269 RepID=A0A437MPA9_9PROT|nr:DUF4011 domain-containing protein [Rhodovarius crocodyli]RVT99477.1 DUF4011 domain-containing protein [Rhodovarius crocodyli]
MPDIDIAARAYEELRERLVDRSRRNRLLHFPHGSRGAGIRIVDEQPEAVLKRLRDDKALRFKGLPEPEPNPRDEDNDEFRAALEAARATDEAYRRDHAAADADNAVAVARVERALRDRVRAARGMPPRPERRNLDLAAWAKEHGVEPSFDMPPAAEAAPDKHKDDALQTLLFPDQLRAQLGSLRNRVRGIEQETGVATLHLALGFLEWFESERDDKPCVSPLLLLPVALEGKRGRGGEEEFRLTATDGTPVGNLSLELRLRDDFRFALPALDAEAENPAETYLAAVAEAVRSRPRWRVRRFITLAPFSFARIAMYRDLERANWAAPPTDHSLVRPLLRAGSTAGEGDDFAQEYDIDAPESVRLAPVLVQDADSSQHSAIIDAMQGRSLVIEGPPGTGKSQTIANLIANALYHGKSVLFVAEKMAALEVVKQRLDRVGLGAFCLSLHSAGARPAAVIEALRQRDALPRTAPAGNAASLAEAARAKTEIDHHLAVMHAKAGPEDETVHDLIGRLAELGRQYPALPGLLRGVVLPAPGDAAAPRLARRKLEAVQAAAQGFDPAASPFAGLARSDLFPEEREKLLAGIATLAPLATAVEQAGSVLAARLGAPVTDMRATLEALTRLPEPPADRSLLPGLAASGAIDALLALDAAQARLDAAGVQGDGADLAPLADLAEGLGDAPLSTLPQLLAQAETEAAGLAAQAQAVLALGVPATSDIGAIRRAARAAQAAAALPPEAIAHRRPGLEAHAAVLADGAARQRRLRDTLLGIEKFDLTRADAQKLREAAATLRASDGMLAFLKADVREARYLFEDRWRTEPRPPRNQWPALLEQAAEAAALRESLFSDAALRALPGALDPREAPLAAMAEAAAWQARPEAAPLLAAAPEEVQRLAALAAPATALLAFLDGTGLPDDKPWAAAQSLLAERGDRLKRIAALTAGLNPALRLSELPALARAAATRDAAPSVPERGLLRATAGFVMALRAVLPNPGPLLADGWTDAARQLRQVADVLRMALPKLDSEMAALAPLGLPAGTGAATLRAMQAAPEGLGQWLAYARTRAEAMEDPLAGPVLAAHPPQGLGPALDWALAWNAVRPRAEAERAVFSRPGAQLSALRQGFAAADRERIRNAAGAVTAECQKRPIPKGSAEGSRRQWRGEPLLQNEMGKKQRFIPVRELMARAADAVLARAPCLMMSPLTVAQYLKPDGLRFDLVVMDEASQIKPEDSVGALLRGAQCVIVGDSKQLPPTNFFDRSLLDDEEDEEDEAALSAEDKVEAESILDLASRAFRPGRRLRWHYRSQHESLIAFSNQEFYDGNLVVFPAARAPSATLGIELVQVNGHWRSKVNVEEAQAIAKASVEFMKANPGLSHGIVAMNQPQKELIEAELARLTRDDEAAAQYADAWEAKLEPPFVKNLENVQGDERDVIMISLGWGRTPQGVMYQRFFPVNRAQDGHRRLNVLFTRAKRKIMLFASLQAEDIVVEPGRTARGVQVLKDYLLYAREGRADPARPDPAAAEQAPFEASVAAALRAKGHEVALSLGVAGYRIDIAVKRQGRFVLGIECDGATYHDARSARDRDRLRQDALERLGWKLARVWSTDWFQDPAAETERLCREIEKAAG